MMDKYGIQMDLLKEIDSICRNNNLTYILYRDIARVAAENSDGRYNNLVVSIAMTRGEALKLKQIILDQNKTDRFIEGIEDNENYLRWSIIYGDVNTTDFHLVKTKNQANRGIHINIDFIEKPHSKVNHIKIGAYMQLRQMTCIDKNEWSLWYAKAAANITPLFGKEKIKNKYISIRSENNIDRWEDIKKFETVMINNMMIPSRLLTDIMDIMLEEHQFIIPKQVDLYLKKTNTKSIDDIRKSKGSTQKIVSTEIGYKEVLSDPYVISLINQANSDYEIVVDKIRNNKAAQNKIKELWEIVIDVVSNQTV